ncbi:MAG: hypothetical protein Q8Q06_00705 [bacterium]|nr:hypothetical protein [bacterium]
MQCGNGTTSSANLKNSLRRKSEDPKKEEAAPIFRGGSFKGEKIARDFHNLAIKNCRSVAILNRPVGAKMQ